MVAQILENAMFFHREFGINAGLLFLTCRCIQDMKQPRATTLKQRQEMASAFRIRYTSVLRVLDKVSQMVILNPHRIGRLTQGDSKAMP